MHIIATYEPTRAAVIVDVFGAAAEPTITRFDANGRHPVRKPTLGPYWQNGPEEWRALDREHAIGGPVRYIATVGDDQAVADVTGLEAAPVNPLLTNPIDDAPDIEVLQVAGLEGARTTSSTVHRVIGSPVPVITYDVLSMRMGTLVLLCPDHAHAARLGAALAGPTVYMLRQREHLGLDMYFTAGAVTLKPAAPGTAYWTVDVPYYEVEPPAGMVRQVPAWTWDSVAATHGTFTDVHATYLTWADLTAGQVS